MVLSMLPSDIALCILRASGITIRDWISMEAVCRSSRLWFLKSMWKKLAHALWPGRTPPKDCNGGFVCFACAGAVFSSEKTHRHYCYGKQRRFGLPHPGFLAIAGIELPRAWLMGKLEFVQGYLFTPRAVSISLACAVGGTYGSIGSDVGRPRLKFAQRIVGKTTQDWTEFYDGDGYESTTRDTRFGMMKARCYYLAHGEHFGYEEWNAVGPGARGVVDQADVIAFVAQAELGTEPQCLVAEPVSKLVCSACRPSSSSEQENEKMQSLSKWCYVVSDTKGIHDFNIKFCCDLFKSHLRVVFIDDFLDALARDIYEQDPLYLHSRKCVLQ